MSDETPKSLKVVVISVGVLLVGGFIWLGSVVAQRMQEHKAGGLTSLAAPVSDCSEITLPLPEEGEAGFLEGEWRVTTPEAIYRYSECGELLQKATLARDS